MRESEPEIRVKALAITQEYFFLKTVDIKELSHTGTAGISLCADFMSKNHMFCKLFPISIKSEKF